MEGNIEGLQRRLEAFRDERDWAQFHSLKDLAAAIQIEAAELQELFLWAKEDSAVLNSQRTQVQAELADVFIQCLNFALVARIDLGAAVEAKIEENARKYPVERARGTAAKYNEL